VAGYARRETLDVLRLRFAYAFDGKGGYPPVVTANLLPDRLEIGGIAVRVVDQPHGDISSAGLRFEAGGRSLVYSTDVNELTEPMIAAFRGTDVWIVDALRRRPHPSHAHLAQALAWTHIIGAGRTILTHMDHSMDYRGLCAELPPGVEPGYDGMEILP
jgi:phosphoribosyl 1,2-cyclic phosphate phosphodiesterase